MSLFDNFKDGNLYALNKINFILSKLSKGALACLHAKRYRPNKPELITVIVIILMSLCSVIDNILQNKTEACLAVGGGLGASVLFYIIAVTREGLSRGNKK